MRSRGRQDASSVILFLTIRFLSSCYRSCALQGLHTRQMFGRASVASRMSSGTQQSSTKSLADFLEVQDPSSTNHVVLGNEAGDADSIISALTLAYVDSCFQSRTKTPMVSTKRADLCLRRETVLLLGLVGVDTEKLIYVDDDASLANSSCKATLVDHNSLIKLFRNWEVAEIVDHHFDEGDHEQVTGEARQIAFKDNHALAGSTCTLITERVIESIKPPYNPDLSLALLGPILLDTVNMSAEAQKGTARDKIAIETLMENTDWTALPDQAAFLRSSSVAPDLTKLYEYLSDSKFDPSFWNELSVTDALRLDYKRFQAEPSGSVFGASSVLLPLSSFMLKKNLGSEINQYMEKSGVPLLAILSFTLSNDVPQRELLLIGKDKKLVDDMVRFLMQSELLNLKEISTEEAGKGIILRQFKQGNARASRKQVAPIMLQFYK